ncbi:MAG TPA: long-chain fatty acid--CoA ligase [Acidobacteriota bacterium]|nr:long-chain fatty acid--CoA ligase [Acidobacteriota bacterium]
MDRFWQQHYDEKVPKSLEFPDLSLYQLLQRAAERNPGGAATYFFGARLSYRQLRSAVDRFAGALSRQGVSRGDRVALMLPNIPGYPIAHFATLKLGAFVVPTNPLYVERELQHQLNDCGAESVVVLDQLYPKLEKVRHQTSVRRVVAMSVGDFLPWPLSVLYRFKNKASVRSDLRAGLFSYRDFIKGADPALPEAPVKPDDTATLLYTGGTTGLSKGAELTHRNLVANVRQTRAWLWSMEDEKDVLLCVLPFFHSYGLTTGMHLAVLSRCTMVLLPRFELPDVARQIQKTRPSVFCGVPSMYNALSRYPKLSQRDLSSIRLCVSGGAALPEDVQSRFEEMTGGKLVEGYGLTETSPVALVNPTHGHRKPGTIGIPVPETDARIVDPETRSALSFNEVGELALRGPQIMKGYWRQPEETARVLSEGWLYTGDLACMDEEGFVKIVDRKKDLIISAGMNVYPREVEEVLQLHPAIVEAAVVGSHSQLRDEIVKAYIVLEEGRGLSKSEIIEFCRDKLAKYKIPRQVEFVQELPKSAIGKVLKRVLKEQ